IRDANATACVVTLNPALTLSQPAALAATLGKTDANCYNTANGVINISFPTGGAGTYEYSVNGGTTWQAAGNFPGLAAGLYNVKIRDAANITCSATLDGAYNIIQPNILTGTITPTNVSVCFANNNGSIVVSAPGGGGGTYQYSDNGGTTWQASGTFASLSAGTYDVRIRDAVTTTCVITLNPTLAITQPTVLAATLTSTNVTCFSAADGTITMAAASGGGGTYEYSVNGGTTWQAAPNFSGLTNASYDVRIRDAVNTSCVLVLNPALVLTQPVVLSATVTPANISVCNNSNNGSIVMSAAAGGTGSYQYTINGGAAWQAAPNFTNLTAATYDVRIRDANATACVVTLNPALTLSQPAALAATLGKTDANCYNTANGVINIS
ncbi:MAG: SprB repeat-containing protein, partial [Sphingobacteriales bacterium]|nr:SprB repeat-containing protein [Sphingobacteriales bacterium]